MANLKDTIVLGNLTVTGKITGAIDSSGGSGVSVDNNNPTLSWGSQSTVATVGGTAITVTMPENPNSDTKVTQDYSAATSFHPLLFSVTSGTSSMNSRGATTALLNNQIYVQPFSGILHANVVEAYTNLKTNGYLLVWDDEEVYTGVNGGTDNFADADIDTTYFSKGITVGGTYNLSFPASSGTFALTSQLKNPTDYYWANIKISSSSNSGASPTFGTATASKVQTSRLIAKDGIHTKICLGPDAEMISKAYIKYNKVTVGTSWTTIFNAFYSSIYYGACRVFFASGSGHGGYVDLVHPKSGSEVTPTAAYGSTTEMSIRIDGMNLQAKVASGTTTLYVWGLGMDA
jgi:hypothetical protein